MKAHGTPEVFRHTRLKLKVFTSGRLFSVLPAHNLSWQDESIHEIIFFRWCLYKLVIVMDPSREEANGFEN